MDKNTITGLVLIAILLVGFSFLSRPSQEQLEAQQRYYDSIAQVQQREADLKAKAEAALANESGAEASVDSTALFFAARQGPNSQVTIQNNLSLLNADRKTFADTEEAVYKSYEVVKNKFTGATENTTIGAVITNAAFPKSSLCKIAGMAHDGYARAIRPVHTSSDGDSIYALSVGDVKADQDMVGTLGAQVMAEAILRAVRSAESAYGLVGAKDL